MKRGNSNLESCDDRDVLPRKLLCTNESSDFPNRVAPEAEIDSSEEAEGMVFIDYANIPAYLQDGLFYQSLDADEQENVILVPAHCFKNDDIISNSEDFALLLRVSTFWGLNKIPVSVLEYCRKKKRSHWGRIAFDCLDRGTYEVLDSYIRSKCTLDAVIDSNRWDFFQHWMFLHPPQVGGIELAAIDVCRRGSLTLLREVYTSGYICDNASTLAVAAGHGHLHCLRFLHEQNCAWDATVPAAAANRGHFDCLVYAHQHGCPWEQDTCANAALSGSVQCLQYALDNGCPHDHFVTFYAARFDRVDCLRLVLERGCTVHLQCCLQAVSANSMRCLLLLREHNAPWNTIVVEEATKLPTADLLRYLFEQGCPYHDNLVANALSGGCSVECLKYLIGEQGLYMDEDGSVFSAALVRADVKCIMYLMDSGCPSTFIIFIRLRNPRIVDDSRLLQCIEYCMDHGWQHNAAFERFVWLWRDSLPLCIRYLTQNSTFVLPEIHYNTSNKSHSLPDNNLEYPDFDFDWTDTDATPTAHNDPDDITYVQFDFGMYATPD